MSSTASEQILRAQPATTSTVTLKQVKDACKAYNRAQTARRDSERAEADKKTAFMKVFEALLGVKAESEVQGLSPDELVKLARRRIRQGLVQLEGIDPEVLLEKVIQKASARRNVSWKDCFINVLGESAATKIIDATDESFSYRFLESALPE